MTPEALEPRKGLVTRLGGVEARRVRPPTAEALVERFGGGILAVVGPEPVEVPFLVGPLVREGGPEGPLVSSFTWTFRAGADLRSVRIEMYTEHISDVASQARGWFQALGYDGPITPRTLPITIDGVPHSFSGESANEAVVVQGVVDGITTVVILDDGWPLDQGLNFARLEGDELDAMLSRSWNHLSGSP
jgi:hypothetical protein